MAFDSVDRNALWLLLLSAACAELCGSTRSLFLHTYVLTTPLIAHHCFVGAAVGREPFTDVSFVDDFAVLVEMLSVLRLMLTVVDQEAQVSWSLVN